MAGAAGCGPGGAVPAGPPRRGAGHLTFHPAQGRTHHRGRRGGGVPALSFLRAFLGLVPCGGDPRRGELCRPLRSAAERAGGLRRDRRDRAAVCWWGF